MIKLDIGCGRSKKEGFTGLDQLKLPGVDIIHDLNNYPYPFADNSVNEIWMDNILEHLKDPVRAIEEVHRISAHGARVTISVPYFRSLYAVIDPTHRNFISSQWFNYFDPGHLFCCKYAYSPARFRVDRLQFDREHREAGRMGLFRSLIVRVAERHPFWYELKLSHLYPLDSLTFHLTAMKEKPQ